MKFLSKVTINLVCLAIMFSSHYLFAAEQPFFLLPKGEEDPLKLKPFLQHYIPELIPLYEGIQEAKASADTEKLLKLKEFFEVLTSKPLSQSEGNWNNLVESLEQEVKGDPVGLWPEQSPQECLGSILFYPQELIHNPEGDETIYDYPGLAASLTISASFGNALAVYKLSKGYSTIASQCRRKPQNDDEEKEQASQDKVQSLRLYKEAIRLFKETINPNKIAQVYLIIHSHDQEQNISDGHFKKQLKKTGHPYAFYELGLFYEYRDRNVQKSYGYYRRALEGGYERGIWGIQRLCHLIKEDPQTEKNLYESGKGQGLYLFAEKHSQIKCSYDDIKNLYERSGQLGHLYSYIVLAERILRQDIPSPDPAQEAVLIYQKADRPGYAQGTRRIIGNPSLCPQPSIEIKFTLYMINLKDIEAYENLLMCWDIKRYHPEIEKSFSSEEESLKKYQLLLEEREKILTLIKMIGTPK